MHCIICYGATIVITAAVLFSCRDLDTQYLNDLDTQYLNDLDTQYLNDLDPVQNTRESLRVLETSLRTPVIMVTVSIYSYSYVNIFYSPNSTQDYKNKLSR